MRTKYSEQYQEQVITKFTLYNSLFSSLPYQDMEQISTYLRLFRQECERGFRNRKSPRQIVDRFLAKRLEEKNEDDRTGMLFKFIQFIERQVVLFDALEDAAYDQTHDLDGSGTLAHLFSASLSSESLNVLLKALSDFQLRLVLTAHPTQFYTGKVLGIITDLEQAFRANALQEINELLIQLSRTPFFKKDKPSPFEEAERLAWYLANVFYEVLPVLDARIEEFLRGKRSTAGRPLPVRLGFWPGGDRDGNPFVTHGITIKVASLLRRTILRCYLADFQILRRKLSFKHLEKHLDAIRDNLQNSVLGEAGYSGPDMLLADLRRVEAVIVRHHEAIFVDKVRALIRKVEIFGFHFATLDIRENARIHHQALVQLLKLDRDWDQFQKLNLRDKTTFLLNKKGDPVGKKITGELANVLDTMKAMHQIRAMNGEAICHRYIISNCAHSSDMATIFHLFRRAGWTMRSMPDIVPLFESVEDLEGAPNEMRFLYNVGRYRRHLQNRNDVQYIMLGFSDGTKDGGYVTANWQIFRAKEALELLGQEFGIKTVFFDGRGGPPARGGGNTHNFYTSIGRHIRQREIQLTVQGQTISSNFGNSAAARYNIEQLLHAGLISPLLFSEDDRMTDADRALIDRISELSYQAYCALKEDPLFVKYLAENSPIKYFGMANIGSRPPSRKKNPELSLDALRAITFVGSWSQLKQNVPGYFGLGFALEQLEQEGKLNAVKALYRSSLFFRTLVENSMMSLSKTNFALTAHLGKDPVFGKFWKTLFNEKVRTENILLEITGLESLMGNQPANETSVRFRENLVMPLTVIQQWAITMLNNDVLTAAEKKLYQNMLIRTLYGITNATRNSA